MMNTFDIAFGFEKVAKTRYEKETSGRKPSQGSDDRRRYDEYLAGNSTQKPSSKKRLETYFVQGSEDKRSRVADLRKIILEKRQRGSRLTAAKDILKNSDGSLGISGLKKAIQMKGRLPK